MINMSMSLLNMLIDVHVDHRGALFLAIVDEDEMSTLAPVGDEKEVEYFFASDARYPFANIHLLKLMSRIMVMTMAPGVTSQPSAHFVSNIIRCGAGSCHSVIRSSNLVSPVD